MSLDERILEKIDHLRSNYGPDFADIAKIIADAKKSLEVKRLQGDNSKNDLIKEIELKKNVFNYLHSLEQEMGLAKEFLDKFNLEEIDESFIKEVFSFLNEQIKKIGKSEIMNINEGVITSWLCKSFKEKTGVSKVVGYTLPIIVHPIITKLTKVLELKNRFDYESESFLEELMYTKFLDKIDYDIVKLMENSPNWEIDVIKNIKNEENNMLLKDLNKFIMDNFKSCLKESYERNYERSDFKTLSVWLKTALNRKIAISPGVSEQKVMRLDEAMSKNLFIKLSDQVLRELFSKSIRSIFNELSDDKEIKINGFTISLKDQFNEYRNGLKLLREQHSIDSNLYNFENFLEDSVLLFLNNHKKYFIKKLTDFQGRYGQVNVFFEYGRLISNTSKKLKSLMNNKEENWSNDLIRNLKELIIEPLYDDSITIEDHKKQVEGNNNNKAVLTESVYNFIMTDGESGVKDKIKKLLYNLEGILTFNKEFKDEYSKVIKSIKENGIEESKAKNYLNNDVQRIIFSFLKQYNELGNNQDLSPQSKAESVTNLLIDYQLNLFILDKKGGLK